MTTPRQTTLTRFLIEQQRRSEETCPPELRLLIETVARACKAVNQAISKGALGDVLDRWAARMCRARFRRSWT